MCVVSQADPFVINDDLPGVIYNKYPVGATPRPYTIDPAKKTLDLIVTGQSLYCNTSGGPSSGPYLPTNASVIDNFNIYDGALWNIVGPLCGVTAGSTNGTGNVCVKIADLMISNAKFDRVILAPIAFGGTFIADWSTGFLSQRFAVMMRRLASRGLTPSTPHTQWINYFGQGPSDGYYGTT